MVEDVTFIGGYDIYYVGNSDFSGICMLIRHDLQPVLTFNDPLGRWMVVQTCIQREIDEFVGVYASQSSAIRIAMWDSIASYPWRSIAFLGEDLANSTLSTDKTTGKSHML